MDCPEASGHPTARLLGLPWELMRDPARELPLALEVAGIDRSLPAAELGASFDGGGRAVAGADGDQPPGRARRMWGSG